MPSLTITLYSLLACYKHLSVIHNQPSRNVQFQNCSLMIRWYLGSSVRWVEGRKLDCDSSAQYNSKELVKLDCNIQALLHIWGMKEWEEKPRFPAGCPLSRESQVSVSGLRGEGLQSCKQNHLMQCLSTYAGDDTEFILWVVRCDYVRVTDCPRRHDEPQHPQT